MNTILRKGLAAIAIAGVATLAICSEGCKKKPGTNTEALIWKP